MYAKYAAKPKQTKTQKSPLASIDALTRNNWKPKNMILVEDMYYNSFQPDPNRYVNNNIIMEIVETTCLTEKQQESRKGMVFCLRGLRPPLSFFEEGRWWMERK